MLWPSLIKKHGGIVTDQLDVSSLSKVTDGYTPGHMVEVIKTVLTERRIKQVLLLLLIFFLLLHHYVLFIRKQLILFTNEYSREKNEFNILS